MDERNFKLFAHVLRKHELVEESIEPSQTSSSTSREEEKIEGRKKKIINVLK